MRMSTRSASASTAGRVLALFALCLIAGTAFVQAHAQMLAPTPPMGWNSWDSYGPAVREDEVKKNADTMSARLKQFGWQYVVVDIEWYQPDAHAHGYIAGGTVVLDDYGRFVPAPNRFPSAANNQGFKPLADYVHSKGLKFGIHIMRGIPREAVAKNLPIFGTKFHAAEIADKVNVCKWANMEDTYGVDMTKPGAQAYYDSLGKLYASWGVDFVKADDMSEPFRGPEIHALHLALAKSGRPIVLSLSPGPAAVAHADAFRENAQMWRISNDFWDRWKDLKAQFALRQVWQGKSGPGGWPDADMLPLGHIGIRAERGGDRASLFTHDEQYTLLTFWSVAQSPLMMGGDLPTSDDFTMHLLSNAEVLDADQHGANSRQAYRKGDILVWTADAPVRGLSFVAAFNLGDTEQDVKIPWTELGSNLHPSHARDLWTHTDAAATATMQVHLRPHASVFYRVSE